ncbi:TPA: hypothetical protein I7730_16045 [Vibrio vulnificus]|uniref:Uncharacterized protein n=1 Tax=Vibrio vulnificus TaxID=672 RepID=A0A8H9N1X0_VIBVL|nr:hypothetical protein [Vibrio vulnificus]
MHTTLNVPFVYAAKIIKPRCRKPVLVFIRDSVEIKIKSLTEAQAPIAFKIGNTQIRWDGQNLWDFDYEKTATDPERVVKLEEVIENTNNPSNYKWSSMGASAPFKNFWKSREFDSKYCQLDNENVVTKADIEYREWISDEREQVLDCAKKIASNLRTLNGYMYAITGEPRYSIDIFGLGNNHGGTGLFIQQHQPSNSDGSAIFNASQYSIAKKVAASIASSRGDTKSLPMKTNCGKIIEVLIPNAIKLPENKRIA